jgi:hypothetical protein
VPTDSSDNGQTKPIELDTVEKCEIAIAFCENVEGRSGHNNGLHDFQDEYAVHEELVSRRVCWKRQIVHIYAVPSFK